MWFRQAARIRQQTMRIAIVKATTKPNLTFVRIRAIMELDEGHLFDPQLV